jgi:hypothetical protein
MYNSSELHHNRRSNVTVSVCFSGYNKGWDLILEYARTIFCCPFIWRRLKVKT